MISIKIRDFRGCERADICCSPIALIAGRNAAGKSSIAQAVGAALSGSAIPVEGMAKAGAGALVHTGAADAIVEIASETGTTKMAWPMCQGATSGDTPPHASSFAAGLTSVAAMDAKERARVLCKYLKADPEEEDFAGALRDAGIGDDAVLKAMWPLIQNQGWDAAWQIRKEKGALLKGRWREITGANYGSRIAASWLPQGWSDNLDGATEEDLAGEREAARRRHEQAIARAAVSEAELEALRRTAGGLREKEDAVSRRSEEKTTLEAELATARAHREGLPSVATEIGMPCPHCGAGVVVCRINLTETKLEKAQVVPAAELKQRRTAKAEADGRVGNLEGRYREAEARLRAAVAERYAAESAAHKLSEAKAEPAAAGGVAAAKSAADLATRRLEMFQQRAKADDVREKIASNDLLLQILAPEGLRKEKLGVVLELFNDILRADAEASGWALVALDDGMVPTYAGRPYGLLSASEQYRVRAVLQCAMAQIDGSDMIIMDAADVLDGPTRSGLFSLLQTMQLSALVCLTLSRRDQLPDLGAIGIGQSSWIENGICEPLILNAEAA